MVMPSIRRLLPRSFSYSLIQDQSFTTQLPNPNHTPTSSGKHSNIPLIISSIASLLWPIFYIRALEGGTVQSIQTKLPKLGSNVLLAIATFTFVLHYSAISSILRTTSISLSSRIRMPFSTFFQALQFVVLILLYVYDHGSDLENHGSYNMAIFSIIALPVNGLIFLIRFWWSSVYATVEAQESGNEKEGNSASSSSLQSRAAKRFAKQAVLVFAGAWLFLHWRLSHYHDLWTKGFFPESEGIVSCPTPEAAASLPPAQAQVCSPATCEWGSFTAYSDLIPAGSQNIWAAWPWAKTCRPGGSADFKAEINDGGEIIISGCPSSTLTLHTRVRRTGSSVVGSDAPINDTETPSSTTYVDVLGSYYGPIISELPNTRMWSWDDKEMERDNSYQDKVLDFTAGTTRSGGTYDDAGRLLPGNLPPKLRPETEVVLVKCGEHERMVTRIATQQPSLPSNAQIASIDKSAEPLNVVVLFFDALSRRHFFRRLPKSASLLDDMAKPVRDTDTGSSKDLALLQLWRYLAVGYNTDPTTRSLLAGKSRHDILSPAKPIWRDYAERGYATGYAADNCQDWSTRYGSGRISRTVQGVGNFSFAERPVTQEMKDKEPKTGSMAAEHEFEAFACMPEFMPLLKSSRGNLKGPNAVGKRCIAGQHVHDLQFNWMNQFMKSYAPTSPSEPTKKQEKPFFLYASFMEAHEGSSEAIAMLDESLSAFLDPKTTSIPLKNTAVFVLADHGLHMGLSRLFLDQGKVEERNPFASILLPAKAIENLSPRLVSTTFTALTPEELQKARETSHLDAAWNEQRMTTSFDMYHTFKHILDYSTSQTSASTFDPVALSDPTMKGPRSGKSLFGGPLTDRDCNDVDVEDWLCRCKVPSHA